MTERGLAPRNDILFNASVLMLQEFDIIPYHLSHPMGERIIVLAPHPDDETLGCGGTIKLLLDLKKQVKIVFLTSGEKADTSHPASDMRHDEEHITDYSLMREKEAVKSLRILGVSDYEFLRFPDREIYLYYKSVLDRLLKIIKAYMPDTIYSPSIIELNPDHRTTAELSLDLQRRMTEREECMQIKLLFYEIITPLRPNILIDITSVYNKKKKAMKKYKSQLKIRGYLKHITGLIYFRSLTADSARYVEAFWCVDEPLREEDIAQWLSYRERINYKV
jgi:LmbE family N-acetylglucosaminyl deacetylase